jgi:hypothetical protein
MTFPYGASVYWSALPLFTHSTPSGHRDGIPTLTYTLKEAPRRSAEVRAADSITL